MGKRGVKKGSHWGHHTEEAKKKIAIAKLGDKNPNWGDKGGEKRVGYSGLHQWIKQHKLKPEFCERCKKNKPYDLANISGEYERDVNDFEWLCRSCHMKSDGRVNSLKPKICFCGKKIAYNRYGEFHKGGGRVCFQPISEPSGRTLGTNASHSEGKK